MLEEPGRCRAATVKLYLAQTGNNRLSKDMSGGDLHVPDARQATVAELSQWNRIR